MLSALLLVPYTAHAAGNVTINGGNPIVAGNFDTTVSVSVSISGGDALNGFDIQVLADQNIITASSVSLAGSLLGTSPRTVLECINGVLVAGSTCAPQDGQGVVHIAAATLGASTTPPTSGLLFTINYNIVGRTTNTPVAFNTGCSGTSSSGICVTISNGNIPSNPLVTVTTQNTTFANLVDFTITPAFGAISGTSSKTDVINYASQGGFADSLTEANTVTPAGLTCTFTTGSADLSSAITASDTISCSGSNGDYTVTVTATGIFTGTSHKATISVHIGATSFTITPKPSSVTVNRGDSGSSTLNVKGISGFGGTVALTASSSQAGVAGSAPSAALTADASGYGTATSALSITVASTVPTGSYALTVNGMSGALTAMATVTVNVPGLDFSVSAVPDSVAVPRGGSAVTTVVLQSIGNFQGTISLSAAVANIANLHNGLTTNIVPSFGSSTVTLAPGGSIQIPFFGSTIKLGSTPSPSDTATGNYTATITATGGGLTRTAMLSFSVFDFKLGPTFCPPGFGQSGTTIYTTPQNAIDGQGYGGETGLLTVQIGAPCTTLTITDQAVSQGGSAGLLLDEVSSSNQPGIVSIGSNPSGGVSGFNPEVPARGTRIPELGHRVCLVKTFWANGTQIPYSYLRLNGPIIRLGLFSGCRFDATAIINDQAGGYGFPNEVPAVLDPPAPQAPFDNPDFWGITAEALNVTGHTLPGLYFFDACGLSGTLFNCHRLSLNVVHAPIIHQLVFSKTISLASSGGTQTFKMGVTNVDTQTLFVQGTVTATDTATGTVTLIGTTGVFSIAPGAGTNNQVMTITIPKSAAGLTFAVSFSLTVSTDSRALTDTSLLTGFSTVNNGNAKVNGTFTVFP